MGAQTDVDSSADHPLITRYPGSYIASYEVEKFRDYDLAYGPVTGYRNIDKRQVIPGKITRITYYLERPVNRLSIGEVYADYLQAFQKANINIWAKGLNTQRNVDKEVGGGTWMGVALEPNAFTQKSAAKKLLEGSSTAGGSFAIVGEVTRPGGNTYLALYGERHSEDLVVCHLDIIETKMAETGKVKADAHYINEQMEEYGSVSIYGINFENNQSSIKSESAPVLEEIALYLKKSSGTKLYVVGHTDMKGSFEYNLQLSEKRAQAVVNALVQEHGISSSRLIPKGVAFLAPKAPNNTEAGRAVNRRTELVKFTE